MKAGREDEDQELVAVHRIVAYFSFRGHRPPRLPFLPYSSLEHPLTNFCSDIGNFPIVSKIKLPKIHHSRSQDERILNRSDLWCLASWKGECIE